MKPNRLIRANSSTWLAMLGLVTSTLTTLNLSSPVSVCAQGASLGSFTYQGRLNDANGPANGVFDLQFSLFPASAGTNNQVDTTITRLSLPVTNGLFTVPLSFPMVNADFDGSDRWLEIAVRPSGVPTNYLTLSPRQQITAAPYSVKAAHAAVATAAYSVPGVRVNTNLSSTAFGLNTTASGNTATAMGFQTTAGGPSSTAMGQNTVASGDSATAMGSATLASGVYSTAMGYLTRATGFVSTAMGANAHANHAYTFVWADGSTPGIFASTTNNQFLVRARNGVGINTNNPQAALHVAGDYALVEGAGGEQAYLGSDGAGFDVQFGSLNTNIYSVSLWNANNFDYMSLFAKNGYFSGPVSISTTNPSAPALTVDGALRVNGGIGGLQSANLLAGTNSVLTIQSVNDPDWGPTANLRAGYLGNTISNGVIGGVIGGGGNAGYPNRAGGNYAVVAGGVGNVAAAPYSTVSGGTINRAGGQESTVSGGAFNSALGFSSTVGGGGGNAVTGYWATISGGLNNGITNATYATIGGGSNNRINTNSTGGTIGGGESNVIRTNAWRATIAGGAVNAVGAPEGTVSGGAFNSALGFSSSVSGGGGNAASGAWSVIAGGRDNAVTNADYATIGGGIQNRIDPGAVYAVISGGGGNLVYSNAQFATIAGGRYNAATNYAFAAGNRAKANHAGTFVWSDTVDADFASTGENQFLIRSSGGVAINTNNTGGAALAVNGNIRVSGNVIGGFGDNVISNGVTGGFIGGGGSAGFQNRVGGNFASVIGGAGNQALGHTSTAGGESSIARGRASVALGWSVTADGQASVALGQSTISSGLSSTAMGYLTRATNDNATAMGQGSIAGGWDSVAMGTFSVASANYSMAAGYYGQANHQGSFVWADSTSPTPFSTTANNQFLIRANGGVGINTASPGNAALAVNGLATSTTGRVNGGNNWDVNNTEGDFRVGNDSYRFKIGVANGGGGSGDVWMRAHGGTARLFVKTPGGTTFYSNEGQTSGVNLAAGGGSWTSLSDRNAKENLRPVDASEVLEKVAALPLSNWNYKSQDAEVRHLGPMAQDFKAAFGLGESDTGITTVDADGVALAAIQGLNRKLTDELKRRDAENADLKARLQRLESLIEKVGASR